MGQLLGQTNVFFLSLKHQVVAETKKSYEKLATLRKEFGHSGSYKSEDGTLYIGIVCFLCWGTYVFCYESLYMLYMRRSLYTLFSCVPVA